MQNFKMAWALLRVLWLAIFLSMFVLGNPPYAAGGFVDIGHLMANLGLIWFPAAGIAATIFVINRA